MRLPQTRIAVSSRILHRSFLMAGILVAGLLMTASSVMAQAALEGETKSLTTKDGWPLFITYYEGVDAGKETPVIVMLHGAKGSRLVWKPTELIKKLHENKFAIVTVDLRKHGESIAPENFPAAARSPKLTRVDYAAMVGQDLEAVKKFIYEEHQSQKLNMRKTGLVAADFSAVIALNWAMADWLKTPYDDAPTLNAKTPRGQDVQAMLMYSPKDTVSGFNNVKALQVLRGTGMAAMLLYGGKNPSDKRAGIKIYKAIGGERQDEATRRMYQREFPTKASGTALLRLNLGKPSPSEFGLLFFRKHLQDLKGVNYEWRDRKSRLK